MNPSRDDATTGFIVSHPDPPRSGVIIALWRPKFEENVAHAVRAAACFDAQEVVLCAPRYVPATGCKGDRIPRPLRHKAYRDVNVRHVSTLPDLTSDGWTPVAIELSHDAASLPNFAHPARALYLFGPEDGSLEASQRKRCICTVQIPARHCLNLAAAINIVLYDRLCKTSH